MTDESIMGVIDNCKRLTFLSVYGTGITVKTLFYASRRQFKFELLNIVVDEGEKEKERNILIHV